MQEASDLLIAHPTKAVSLPREYTGSSDSHKSQVPLALRDTEPARTLWNRQELVKNWRIWNCPHPAGTFWNLLELDGTPPYGALQPWPSHLHVAQARGELLGALLVPTPSPQRHDVAFLSPAEPPSSRYVFFSSALLCFHQKPRTSH